MYLAINAPTWEKLWLPRSIFRYPYWFSRVWFCRIVFEPTCAYARSRWALMLRFLSVCPSVRLGLWDLHCAPTLGYRTTLCTTDLRPVSFPVLSTFLSPAVLMHGGLISIAFCLFVCLSITEPKCRLENNSYIRKHNILYGAACYTNRHLF